MGFDNSPIFSWRTLTSGVAIGSAVVVLLNHFPLLRGGPYLPLSYRLFGFPKQCHRFGVQTCREELHTVLDVFKSTFAKGLNLESQLCVYSDGEKVMDVFGCPVGNKDYDSNTLQVVFSCTKIWAAVVVATLVD
eukprot:324203-Pyramimonas_sp.AAC.1